MFKNMNTKLVKILLTLGVVIIAFVLILNASVLPKNQLSKGNFVVQPTNKVASQTFTYQGVESENALFILKSHATIKQNNSGLVTSINGRKTDSSTHEYWAFYVNGKLANVGPADYVTKKGDTILWKIEKY